MLHNILPCGTNLKRWKIKESSICSICQIDQDITHLLYTCRHVRHVWLRINNVLARNVRATHVIFGMEHDFNLNFIISLVSYIVYKEWILCEKNDIDRDNFNILGFISRELIYRHMIFKHMHWFDNNMQIMFEKVVEEIANQVA